jgi:hypothetical protein
VSTRLLVSLQQLICMETTSSETVAADGMSATFPGVSHFSIHVTLKPTGSIPGDVNGDGVVNCTDVALVKAAFGTHLGQPGFNPNADVNNDSVVNIIDLAFVTRLLPAGTNCSATTAAQTETINAGTDLPPRDRRRARISGESEEYTDMKLSSFAQIALLACASCVVSYAGTVVSLNPATQNAAIGQTISLDIDITGVSDLYAWQFDLGFDPTRLEAVSISEGGFLAAGGITFFVPGVIDNVFGTISSTADTLTSAISGASNSGKLAIAEFEVIGTGSSSVNIFNPILLDSTLSSISATTASATVNVISPSAPEPSTFWPILVGVAGVSTTLAYRRPKTTA